MTVSGARRRPVLKIGRHDGVLLSGRIDRQGVDQPIAEPGVSWKSPQQLPRSVVKISATDREAHFTLRRTGAAGRQARTSRAYRAIMAFLTVEPFVEDSQ
jgi:hypothetical protein